MSEKVSDVVTQLEALIAGIATKTPRECDKWCTRGHSAACDGRHSRLLRAVIARTVERMLTAAVSGYEVNGCSKTVRDFYVAEALGAR